MEREKCAMLNQRAKKVMVMSLLVDPITRYFTTRGCFLNISSIFENCVRNIKSCNCATLQIAVLERDRSQVLQAGQDTPCKHDGQGCAGDPFRKYTQRRRDGNRLHAFQIVLDGERWQDHRIVQLRWKRTPQVHANKRTSANCVNCLFVYLKRSREESCRNKKLLYPHRRIR